MSLYRKNLDMQIDELRASNLELRNAIFAHERAMIDSDEFRCIVTRCAEVEQRILSAHGILIEVEAKYDAMDDEAATKVLGVEREALGGS